MNNDIWKSEAPKRPEQKKLSPSHVKKFGLSIKDIKVVDKLEDLKLKPPSIVIAECVEHVSFMQNWFKEQTLAKNNRYVMGLGVYQQLHHDTRMNRKILKPAKIKFKNLYKPYEGQNLDNKTLIVSRTGGIGDLLFIQPNLTYLKQKYPTCKIGFACGPQYQAMIDNWDSVDEILDLPFSIKHLFNSDYQIIFEGVIERCKEAETTNAYNLFTKWMGLNLPDELLIPKQEPKKDKVEKCFEIIENWGLKEPFLLFQLRASSPVRCPDIQVWIKLVDKLTDKGHNIVITDMPKQTEGVDMFISKLKHKDRVFNFCKHSKSLDYTIAMCSLSKGVISTDSALLHIAASLGISLFGIYGPFPAEIRLSTYPNADWINAKKECAPCFQHGGKPCKEAGNNPYSPCYDNLDLDDAVIRIEKLIG
jgi:ADP-heptose:LPS heptosyltransferase